MKAITCNTIRVRTGCEGEESSDRRKEEGMREEERGKKRGRKPCFDELQQNDYRWQSDSQKIWYSCP